MSDNHPIDTYFELLDKWRHFPAYRLEPRVDVFFALYLREVINFYIKDELIDEVIPEFPLRLGTLYADSKSGFNSSKKVDFVLFSVDLTTAYFIELKTDRTSRNETQDGYLNLCTGTGFYEILKGFLQIIPASDKKQKYLHLLKRLECLGLVDVPEAVYDFAYPIMRPGFSAAFNQIKIKSQAENIKVSIIYVQPDLDSALNSISFQMFAQVVSAHDDPVSKAFCKYLVKWSGEIPGSFKPPDCK